MGATMPHGIRLTRDHWRVSDWFQTYGFAEVHEGLLIGAYPLDEQDVRLLSAMTVRRVLNLVEDDEYAPGRRELVAHSLSAARIEEHRLSLTDYGRLPPAQLELAVATVVSWMDQGLLTYVHCRAGWQRSAAVAAGAVAVYDGVEIDEALTYVQHRKPSAAPLPHQLEDLAAWWQARRAQAIEPAPDEP
jgi:protein-tyrosine phosphatase